MTNSFARASFRLHAGADVPKTVDDRSTTFRPVQGGEQMQSGRFPTLGDTLAQVTGYLKGRRFGAPLAQFRPAIPGHPIGGPKGNDIQLTFERG